MEKNSNFHDIKAKKPQHDKFYEEIENIIARQNIFDDPEGDD